jgi:hypothetical protein
MKKLILITLSAFIFSFASLGLAQTTTETTPTQESITAKPVEQPKAVKPHKAKGVAGAYVKCLNVEMKNLTKEMHSRKKNALNEYKSAVKSATSTEAKKEARRAYNAAVKDINKWFTQATKEAKSKCRPTATSTPTSTATSTQ